MPFSSSTPITTFAFRPDNVILPHSHLVGTIIGVMPPKASTLCLKLKCCIPQDQRADTDYNMAKEASTTKYLIDLHIQAEHGGSGADEIQEQVAAEARRLAERLSKSLTVDVGGMRVVVLSKNEKGCPVAKLEGSGNRMCVAQNGERMTLLPALPFPSQTPAWFATPPDSAGPTTHSSPPPPPPLNPGSSRLRPLTSHAIPSLDAFAPRSSEPSRNGSAERLPVIPLKRAKSPEKTSEGHESKRNKIGDEGAQAGDEARLAAGYSTYELAAPRAKPTDHPDPKDLAPAAGSSSRPASLSPQKPLKQSPQSSPRPAQISKTIIHIGGPSRIPPVESSGSINGDKLGRLSVSESDIRLSPGIRGSSPLKRHESVVSNSADRNRNPSETIGLESPSPGSNRRQVEAEALATRRREAEDKARAEAEARRAEKEAEAGRLAEDRDILTSQFTTEAGVTYTPLKSLQIGTARNVMGIVLDVQGTKTVSSGDWVTTVIVADPSSHVEGTASDDLAVTIFRNAQGDLPFKLRRGTPILFRHIKISDWKDKPKGNAYNPARSGDANTWGTMDKSGNVLVAEEANLFFPVTDGEIERLAALRRWWIALEGEQRDNGTAYVDERGSNRDSILSDAGSGKLGHELLSAVRNRHFFTAVVKILHVVSTGNENSNRPSFELYVTDGTVSPFETRNFHGVTDTHLPPSAIFSLAIFDRQPPHVAAAFAPGNIVEFKNVRVNDRQGLELKWSDKVTDTQLADGWKARKCCVLPKEDDRVRVINTRINAFKRGENPAADASRVRVPIAYPPAQPIAGPSRSDPLPTAIPLATHVGTIYHDEIEHPISDLSAVVSSSTLPNKYRVQARVASIHPRGSNGNTLVEYYCTKCKRQFTTAHCLSCNDDKLIRAELRYRFFVRLEQDDETLLVVIADKEAEEFLPPLPPIGIPDNGNINNQKKIQTRIREVSEMAHEILLGAKMDGERSRPLIDWSVLTYEAKQKRSGKELAVVVFKAFGMKSQ